MKPAGCNMTEEELTLAFAEGLFTDDEYIRILGEIKEKTA